MARLYPVCTRGETVTPRDVTNNQEPQGPAKTVGKIGSFKMHANGGNKKPNKRVRCRPHCKPALSSTTRQALGAAPSCTILDTWHLALGTGHWALLSIHYSTKKGRLSPALWLVKKLMMSRRLDAKHGAFYLLQHTRIGQPPQSGHIYSLVRCISHALTGEFSLSTHKKWGQAQCSRPGPHFSLQKVSGCSKNPSTSPLRKTAPK